MRRSVIALLAAALLLAAVPWLGLPPFAESMLYLILHWVALASSWNLLSGYSGYFSFGHGAFFGIGMYTTAALTSKLDWPFLWTLPAAAAMSALVGTLIGLAAFRVHSVRAELFALLTLATTFVVATVILNTPIDGGPGVYLNAVPVPALGPTPSGTFYLLALGAAMLSVLAAAVIYHSRLGTGLLAIHDDEDVAEVMGVPTYRYKLGTFALSCALAGLVGGIQALFVSYVTAGDTFTITMPLTVVLMSVLGGSRHWAGPIVGATAITLLLFAFTGSETAIVGKGLTGLILVVVILFMPEGIVGQTMKWWKHRRAGKAAEVPRPPASPTVLSKSVPAVQATGSGTVLLRARGVRKHFRGVQALRGVDLEVRKGEILGLLGPNGSGKSTFINVVSGHFALTAGEIDFDGLRISHLPAHRVARSGIARTYQIPRPFAHLTVLQNVALPAMFGAAGLDRRSAEQAAWQWLEFTGLADKADALPDDLNLHQRKFLEFARALASRPQVLMLDEVLSGLTPSEIDGAVDLIRRIRDQGATIVFVEHVMRAVMALCDRIVVFEQGQVLAEGAPQEVMQRPEVVAAYLGAPGPASAAGSPPAFQPAEVAHA
ncbi:branched-chain amino acid ABC transporter ATP-binding protein/permease [Variovorax saccharolyticus]|uniref:branched-chain amino acid ABC transporter ATP-binding protein/permease n=1 Tax=Variovorax saccharolyticus TaxID=3053516 RepID=UPI002576838C|nr:branched-chain amino acid ABC transporter ATP-binding protein/permease [Variovorax sp. J31P216]MDM0026537.1 branched-chain amino acid ABC transporter ATP-binding protein/permease [Variovorax sp. J31P216]